MMNAQEAAQFFAYAAGNPLDDQSNHHLPIASLQAAYFNSKRDPNTQPTHKIGDFMLFRKKEEQDVEQLLLSDDW